MFHEDLWAIGELNPGFPCQKGLTFYLSGFYFFGQFNILLPLYVRWSFIRPALVDQAIKPC